MTANWLKSGDYEVESLGRRVPVTAHFRGTPFDPKGDRIKGRYDRGELEVARQKLESIRKELVL